MPRRVFVSATTADLGSYRDAVAKALKARGLEPVVQKDFPTTAGGVNAKLRRLMSGCDAAVFLVGECYGGAPKGQETEYPRSYTQLEYDFAKSVDMPCWLFVADKKAEFDEHRPEPADLHALQVLHRKKVTTAGKDSSRFSTPDELLRLVERMELPWGDDGGGGDKRGPKPNNLDRASIGKLFKGRDETLEGLRARLTAGGAAAVTQPQALCGLGGVGKTRAAVEYAWRFHDDYEALLFVVADSPAGLATNLAGLTGVLPTGLADAAEQPENVRTEAVVRWLLEHPGWLLILDNADMEEAAGAVAKLAARLSIAKGHLLITSRLTAWPASVPSVELNVLSEEAATAFLLERTAQQRAKRANDEAEARQIAKDLDGLALALEQAGAGINARRYSLAKYREVWQAEAERVLEWHDPIASEYPRPVAVTWQVTIDNLTAETRTLLELFSFFAADPVPRSLFETAAARKILMRVDITDADAAIRELLRFSLLAADRAAEEGLRVHRLVQKVARDRVAPWQRRVRLRAALRLVDAAFRRDPGDVQHWPVLEPLAPHAAAVTLYADKDGIAEPTARLMSRLGILFWSKAAYARAEPLYRRALAIGEATLGPDSLRVAARLNKLTLLLRDIGRYAEAEPLVRRALMIVESVLGTDHPYVAASLNKLGRLLRDTDRRAEAEPLLRRALAIAEAGLSPDHPDLGTAVNNLAELLRATGRQAEAEPLVRRALAISEAAYGQDQYRVATRLNSLAGLLREIGRYPEAEPLVRRALAIAESALRSAHPRVASRMFDLAELLRETDRYAEAEPFYRQAVEISEETHGPDHPRVGMRLRSLAGLLRQMDRCAEAEPVSKRAEEILRRFEEETGHRYTGH